MKLSMSSRSRNEICHCKSDSIYFEIQSERCDILTPGALARVCLYASVSVVGMYDVS